MQHTTKKYGDFKSLHQSLNAKPSITQPKAFSLDDEDPELDLSTWVAAETPRGRHLTGRYPKLQPGEMSCRLQISYPERKRLRLAPDAVAEATTMYLRFGTKVIKSLGWRENESFALFQHPQDKTVYGIMPTRDGKKLLLETSKSPAYYLTFRFKNDLKYLIHISRIVEFSVHENGYILFRLPEQVKA